MARRSTVRRVEEVLLFDVLYEDGTRTSNRKVPGSELGDVGGDLHCAAVDVEEPEAVAAARGVQNESGPDQVLDPRASPLSPPGVCEGSSETVGPRLVPSCIS